MGMALILIFFTLISSLSPSYGYDPIDPHANVTIKWDFMQMNSDTYDVKVSIFNYQHYRHVDQPGWKVSWRWQGGEVIWNMWGAETTLQGNCSKFKGGQLPHCCEMQPVIVDLLPGAPYNLQVANCCKGGVLTSMIQDPSKFGSGFQMNIGSSNVSEFLMPANFSLGVGGYSCGDPIQVPPSRFSVDGGRRWTQALETRDVTCIYSQNQASDAPKCCVSLSAFYNSTIVPCPQCSCGCQGLPGAKCVKPGETPPLLQLPHNAEEEEEAAVVKCSPHMCPIKVHWHVKESYKEYWRVKITVTNLNFVKNYSQWSLVVMHPNLHNITQIFSFNYMPLNQYGYINDTGMFWGIKYYNDMLLQCGMSGNVQTEMLMHKDAGIFSFREGWVFPRRILFNGDECVMPPPDDYPRLPNAAIRATPPYIIFFFFTFIVVFSNVLR